MFQIWLWCFSICIFGAVCFFFFFFLHALFVCSFNRKSRTLRGRTPVNHRKTCSFCYRSRALCSFMIELTTRYGTLMGNPIVESACFDQQPLRRLTYASVTFSSFQMRRANVSTDYVTGNRTSSVWISSRASDVRSKCLLNHEK